MRRTEGRGEVTKDDGMFTKLEFEDLVDGGGKGGVEGFGEEGLRDNTIRL